MTIDGTSINTNSREYIEFLKELERDSEISDATHPLQTVQSWPATAESALTEMDALFAAEEIGLPGVPYAERSERTDEPAAISYLRVRQAGA